MEEICEDHVFRIRRNMRDAGFGMPAITQFLEMEQKHCSQEQYWLLSGQLKTLLERCNPLYSSDYTFGAVYLLAMAAEEEASTVDGSVKGLQGWVDCFAQATLMETIFAGGITTRGEIKQHPALERACKAGKAII